MIYALTVRNLMHSTLARIQQILCVFYFIVNKFLDDVLVTDWGVIKKVDFIITDNAHNIVGAMEELNLLLE